MANSIQNIPQKNIYKKLLKPKLFIQFLLELLQQDQSVTHRFIFFVFLLLLFLLWLWILRTELAGIKELQYLEVLHLVPSKGNYTTRLAI